MPPSESPKNVFSYNKSVGNLRFSFYIAALGPAKALSELPEEHKVVEQAIQFARDMEHYLAPKLAEEIQKAQQRNRPHAKPAGDAPAAGQEGGKTS